MKKKHEIWNLPEKTVRLMVLFGFAFQSEDGIYEFTDKGTKWIHDYCDKVIAEHEAAA